MSELPIYYLQPSDSGLDSASVRRLITNEVTNLRSSLKIGAGDQVFKASNEGIQLGSGTFSASPFSVDMDGNVYAATLVATGVVNSGDGSDGDVTISSNTTLTRDMQYNSLIVNASVTLTTAGFSVLCKGSITINGTIDNSGGAGANGSVGSGGAGGTRAAGTLGGGGSGGAGARTVDGTGAPATGTAGGASSPAAGATGGYGGGITALYRSAAGTVTAKVNVITSTGALIQTGSTIAVLMGGSGGGGGYSTSTSGNWSSAGGGGAGGGVIDIICMSLINNGVISANGGNGGNGTGGGSGGGQSSGGGGGGGGGCIRIITRSSTGAGTVTVTGGTHGNGYGAENGQDGTGGNIYQFILA